MNNNLENIDQLFKDALSNHKEIPPTHLWNSIQTSTASNAAAKIAVKKGITVFSKWMLASISVAAIGTAAYFIHADSQEDIQKSVQQSEIAAMRTDSLSSFNNPSESIPQNNQNLNLISNQEESRNLSDAETINAGNGFDRIPLEVGTSKVESPKENPELPTKQSANQHSDEITSKAETQILSSISLKHTWKIETADVAENAKMFSIVTNYKLTSATFYFGDGKFEKLIEQQNPFVSHEYFVANTKQFKTKVVLRFADGQKDSQYVHVFVNPIQPVGEAMIPDVFTPNGDGRNDKYLVFLPKPESFEMVIMDLQNRQIFNTLNIFEGWDGRCGKDPCASGEYRVILKTKYSGEPEKVSYKKILLKNNLN